MLWARNIQGHSRRSQQSKTSTNSETGRQAGMMQEHDQNLLPPSEIVTNGHFKPNNAIVPTKMELDMATDDGDRLHRAASVLSGMSAEDMEAAKTLKSLQANFNSPSQSQPPPIHLQTTTPYDSSKEPEPILQLITSQYPIAAPLINGSLSAYKTTQSFIPGAYFMEQNVGLPLAGKIGRVTGVEGGLRWALQRRESVDQAQISRLNENSAGGSTHGSHDVEKGLGTPSLRGHSRRASGMSFESLPAYDESGRSPPYQEHQLMLQTRERQPSAGWTQQLVISTSALGVAMSEESLRSLRYCLNWLMWSNQRLAGAIQSLKDLLQQWDRSKPQSQSDPQAMSSSSAMANQSIDFQQAALTSRIAALKTDVLSTLKQVVDIVSRYAGGALPENARNLVHRHLTSLPQRFSIASAHSSTPGAGDEAASSAQRVMVLAQQGLDMISQVSHVVGETLASAESWCDKLGRRRPQQQQQQQQGQNQPLISQDVKMEQDSERGRSATVGREGSGDVKMQM